MSGFKLFFGYSGSALLPLPYEDLFNRTDSGTVGVEWAEILGAWSVTGNALKCDTAPGLILLTGVELSDRVRVEATVKGNFTFALYARWDAGNSSNIYAVYDSGSGAVAIVENNTLASPNETTLATGSAGTLANGDIVALQVIGTDVAFYKNGVLVCSNAGGAPATVTAAGWYGVYGASTAAEFDSFAVDFAFTDAALSQTDSADTAAAAGALATAVALAQVDAEDSASSTATLGIAASLATTDSGDTLVSAAALSIDGSLSLTDAQDSLSSSAAAALSGSVSLMDDDDALSKWTRNSTNPILLPGEVSGPDGKTAINIADACVVWAGDHWRLYFATAYDQADVIPPTQPRVGIALATSTDGKSWTVVEWNCLLPTAATGGSSSDWDYTQVETPSVIRNPDSGAPASETWMLFYSGANNTGTLTPLGTVVYSVGLAYSADGVTFTRLSAGASPYGVAGKIVSGNEIMPSSPPTQVVVADPTVVLFGGDLHMWVSMIAFQGSSIVSGGICLARSADGVSWVAEPTNPLQSLYRTATEVGWQPAVIDNGSGLEMLFTSDTAQELSLLPYPNVAAVGFWRATSSDGISWVVDWSRREFECDRSLPNEDQNLVTGVGLSIKDGIRHLFYSAYSTNDIPPSLSAYPVVWNMNQADAGIVAVAVAATVGAVDSSDTCSASAVIGSAPIEATLDLEDEGDLLSAAAALAVAATLSQTDGADSLASSAAAAVAASLSVQDADDAPSSAADLEVAVALSQVDATDTVSSMAGVGVASTLTQTDVIDTLVTAASIGVAATLTQTDATDALDSAANTGAPITAALVLVDDTDVLNAVAEGLSLAEPAPSRFLGFGRRKRQRGKPRISPNTYPSTLPDQSVVRPFISAALSVVDGDDTCEATAYVSGMSVGQKRRRKLVAAALLSM